MRMKRKKVQSKAKEVGSPCEAGVGFKKRKGISSPLEKAFGIETRDQLDQEIARFSWKEKGVTIVSDGWSDPTRKPLINYMATSGNGHLFLKAVNCFGEVKGRFFIVDLMKEVINEIGHHNVVQIITDNAANCKAAGEVLESQFPHIYWTPCVVHTLNLALKNICSPRYAETNVLPYEECKWIKEVHTDALAIKNFIINHNMRLLIFTKFSPIRLLSVADTCFASIIVMLKRLKLIKRGLQAMVIREEWSSYREDDTVKAK